MSEEKNLSYVTHTCKNIKLPKDNPNYCDRGFNDVDRYNVTTIPPTWKYCKECEAKGYKNPRTRRDIKPPTEKQIIAREKFAQMVRDKHSKIIDP